MADGHRLLASLRVLDVAGGDADAVTRVFADLGADVLKVEPPGGSRARTSTPTLAQVSLPFALHNANKRSTVLDPAAATDRRRFADLAATADIVVDSGTPGQACAYGLSLHGVPIAAVLPPSQVLASPQFRAIGAVTEAELVAGIPTTVPVGYFVVDGKHAGLRAPAPSLGGDEPRWRADAAAAVAAATGRRPFDGLRIIDLGVIIVGGELSRLFGDLGAEVIKVESAAYPDGLRQARHGEPMSESFAWTHRNKLGLGLDLRSPAGCDIFTRLVAGADAVFANFKPGTLAALGLSYERLRAVNPRIVLAESSAFGENGPWSSRMGYGPLVRASTGVTWLWTDTDTGADPRRHQFYDATTVFPDHVVGRITAIGALAALIHRDRTGVGVGVHVSQAEAAVNQLDTRYVAEATISAPPVGGGEAGELCDDTSVHAVCPCAGDDEWCVVSIRSDADWQCATAIFGCDQLADDPRFATGRSRIVNRRELIAQITRWTHTRTALQVGAALQFRGVPAGQMNRPPDIPDDPQLGHRKVFADMRHPLFGHPLPAETGPARFRQIPTVPQRPAPLPGQHTREICRKILAMSTAEIEQLITTAVLFTSAGE